MGNILLMSITTSYEQWRQWQLIQIDSPLHPTLYRAVSPRRHLNSANRCSFCWGSTPQPSTLFEATTLPMRSLMTNSCDYNSFSNYLLALSGVSFFLRTVTLYNLVTNLLYRQTFDGWSHNGHPSWLTLLVRDIFIPITPKTAVLLLRYLSFWLIII